MSVNPYSPTMKKLAKNSTDEQQAAEVECRKQQNFIAQGLKVISLCNRDAK